MAKGNWVYKVRVSLELSVEAMERQSRGNYCSQEKDKGGFSEDIHSAWHRVWIKDKTYTVIGTCWVLEVREGIYIEEILHVTYSMNESRVKDRSSKT